MLVIAKKRNLFLSLMIVTALAFSFTGCQMTGTQKGAGAGADVTASGLFADIIKVGSK